MASTSEIMDLTRLDQTMLRVYVRQLLIFPLPSFCERNKAIDCLTNGLLLTMKRFPFLAGTVEQTDPLTGALTVRYPKDIDSELVSRLLTVNELDDSGLHYESLCKDGVPPSRLSADIFCPYALRSHPGVDDPYAEVITTFAKGHPIPVFAAQINFISGGLVISAYTHHSVVDGTGIAKVYQIWSGHTRTYKHGTKTPTQVKAVDLNNARHALDSLKLGAPARNLPEFRYPDDLVQPPLRDYAYNLSAKLLVFPALAISRLATSLSEITKVRISPFVALTTLVWCYTADARRAAMVAKGIDKTTLGIATDHRKRVGSLLPNDYLGNCANGLTVSVPLSSIPTSGNMDSSHIAPVALALFHGLREVDLDWFRARLLEMSKQTNSSKLMLKLDTRNGPDIFITSWTHIGADDLWAIGGTAATENGEVWCCKPTAIRKPHNMWEGGMQILPRRKGNEAPYEIPLCLEEEEMKRALNGLQAGNWIEKVLEA